MAEAPLPVARTYSLCSLQTGRISLLASYSRSLFHALDVPVPLIRGEIRMRFEVRNASLASNSIAIALFRSRFVIADLFFPGVFTQYSE